MRNALALCWFCILFTLLSCSAKQHTIVLIDESSEKPIQGALVFQEQNLTILRSDRHGQVTIPPTFSMDSIGIHAKNYLSKSVKNVVAVKTVYLQYDSTNANPAEAALSFSRADSLRGSYGPFRANNDVLTYDLSLRVNIEDKFLSGTNNICFNMLENGDKIQIDLFENMAIDSILFEGNPLDFTREFNTVFIDFPRVLKAGETYEIDFHYSGHPKETGRFGGFVFSTDSLGNPWIFTACQGIGASLWWPNKDQQRDEVDSMRINVEVPAGFIDVSNGRLMNTEHLADGFVRYKWKVHYPINNYSVSVNIGKYVHFADTLGDVTMDFYALPYHLPAAKRQFAQAKPMLEIYENYFGDFPFPRDGYKLIEVPYSGMEHQSAVTYGNQFKNGYLGRDWTGVGVSSKFDFIIIHESGHEWFGNSVTCNDVSDAWIQEGWCTYAEVVYVEGRFGYKDALKYVNGYKEKVRNARPIIGPGGVNDWPGGDQYFKGALFLNTLRHVVDSDSLWWALIRDYADHFKYQNIWTTDVINFFNNYVQRDFRPIFEHYLYRAEIPKLQLRFDKNNIAYRWHTVVDDFDMPIKVRVNDALQWIYPTTAWKSEAREITPENWQVATDLFYVDVEILEQ